MPTKVPLAELQEMGKFPRSYDGGKKISEPVPISDSENEEEEVQFRARARKQADEVLQWAKMIVPGLDDLINDDKKAWDQKELIAYFADIRHAEEKAAVTPKGRLKAIPFLRFAVDAFIDLFSATRDVIEGRRQKTALAVIGCILVGAAIGAVLGTFIFPGIGSAAGATAGGIAVSVLIAVGGTFGLATLGAAIGSWIGKKLGKSWFQDESRYEFRKSKANNIHDKLSLDEEDTERINAYLRNRADSDPFHREMCREVRIGITKKPTKKGVEIAIRFFINEIILLQDETWEKCRKPEGLDKEQWEAARKNEIKAVVAILQAFTKEELIQRSIISREAAECLQEAIKDSNINSQEHDALKKMFSFREDRPSHPSERKAGHSDLPLYDAGPSHSPPQHTPSHHHHRHHHRRAAASPSSSRAPSHGELEEIFRLSGNIENGNFLAQRGQHNIHSVAFGSDSVTLTFHGGPGQRTPSVYIHRTEGGLQFSTTQRLGDSDFKFVTARMAEVLKELAQDAPVTLASVSEQAKKTALQEAFPGAKESAKIEKKY